MSQINQETRREEKQSVTIHIDGHTVQVPAGTTVLAAARRLHIPIPTLCYHEAVREKTGPHGACRLCIVELSICRREKVQRWFDAACVYPAEEGLAVRTQTPEIRSYRKLLLELLLAKAPAAGALQGLAREYGALSRRFPARPNNQPACILCGLCTLVCNELVGNHAIGLAYRGIAKQVLSPLDTSRTACVGCQACAHVCPTGAIEFVTTADRLTTNNWSLAPETVRCTGCGEPFMTLHYYEKLKALLKARQVTVSEETLALCPNCRRRRLRSAELLS